MRKKIEVTSEDWREADVTPPPAPDGDAPEFGDHVNPVEEEDTNTSAQHNGVPEGTEAYIVALQADLDEARRQIEVTKDLLLRSQADFQNFRKRKEEEQKDLAKYANSEIIKSLLPVIDNFERALQAAEQTRNFDALVGGVAGTLKQMQGFLQKAGVTPIEAVGKEFDPKFHDAIGHSENADVAPNTVAEEVQRGYIMHDRVLRPALVKVAQG